MVLSERIRPAAASELAWGLLNSSGLRELLRVAVFSTLRLLGLWLTGTAGPIFEMFDFLSTICVSYAADRGGTAWSNRKHGFARAGVA